MSWTRKKEEVWQTATLGRGAGEARGLRGQAVLVALGSRGKSMVSLGPALGGARGTESLVTTGARLRSKKVLGLIDWFLYNFLWHRIKNKLMFF